MIRSAFVFIEDVIELNVSCFMFYHRCLRRNTLKFQNVGEEQQQKKVMNDDLSMSARMQI